MNIQKLAQILDEAAKNAQPIPQISLETPFSETDAYDIQKASLERRYARGEQPIGLKMGFTSKAKMEQMGVHDMIWGRLTDAMRYQDGDDLPFQKFIHPRAEPEICFLIKKDIPGAVSLENIKDYVVAVAGAIEIIDSRYQNFKFSLEDVIADNCSSSGLVIGAWHSADISLDNLKIDLIVDGEVVQSGSSAAILGNPWESLVAATRLAAQYGEVIKAGQVIMAGAATSAVYLKTGQKVSAKVENLGEVSLNVV
jgi:2-oxo-3-hexenedioate decarboxylase